MDSQMWNWLGYFTIGIFVGGGFTAFWFSIKDKVVLKWYEWLLSIVIIFMVGFTSQTFFASYAEREPQAAWMSLIFLGIPIVILAVIELRSVRSRMPKS